MSREDFILERLGRMPDGHIARQAGCSVDLVRAVKAASGMVAVEIPALPMAVPKPKRVHGVRRCKTARPRIWRVSLPGPVHRVVQEIAERHGVSLYQLTDANLNEGGRALCAIRQEAYYAVWQMRDASGKRRFGKPTIGSFFGGRHHTTIMHGIRAHERRLAATAAPVLGVAA